MKTTMNNERTNTESWCCMLGFIAVITFIPIVCICSGFGLLSALLTLVGEVIALLGTAYLIYKTDDHADD